MAKSKKEKAKPEDKEGFPEVRGTGVFQAVASRDGYAVYNPGGQRVSGILKKFEAEDIVKSQNLAGNLKPAKGK